MPADATAACSKSLYSSVQLGPLADAQLHAADHLQFGDQVDQR
jgi:hypothetical protein